jgi:hypothetical protein
LSIELEQAEGLDCLERDTQQQQQQQQQTPRKRSARTRNVRPRVNQRSQRPRFDAIDLRTPDQGQTIGFRSFCP